MSISVKTKIEELNAKIKEMNDEIVQLKSTCKHENTKKVSSIHCTNGLMFDCIDETCEDCGELVNVVWGSYCG